MRSCLLWSDEPPSRTTSGLARESPLPYCNVTFSPARFLTRFGTADTVHVVNGRQQVDFCYRINTTICKLLICSAIGTDTGQITFSESLFNYAKSRSLGSTCPCPAALRSGPLCKAACYHSPCISTALQLRHSFLHITCCSLTPGRVGSQAGVIMYVHS